MAWVRFPDGARRKVERIEKADAQPDLDELLALRAQSLEPGPRHTRKVTFNQVIDAWFADGWPNVAQARSRAMPGPSRRTPLPTPASSSAPASAR